MFVTRLLLAVTVENKLPATPRLYMKYEDPVVETRKLLLNVFELRFKLFAEVVLL